MNEEKYFELTGGFRPDFIAEAAEWKHEDHSAESEIGAIFEADLKRRTQELHSDTDTEKELPSVEAAEVEPIEPMPEISQNDMPRHLAAGITAIAAAIALTIGALVYMAQRPGDSMITPAGTTLADSSILSVQTGMEPGSHCTEAERNGAFSALLKETAWTERKKRRDRRQGLCAESSWRPAFPRAWAVSSPCFPSGEKACSPTS